MDSKIILPYRYREYKWERKILVAFWKGLVIWLNLHRRAGKDLLSLCRILLPEAFKHPGTYHYIWPLLKQGRDAIWEGKDEKGRDILDYYVPKNMVIHKDNADMKLTLRAIGGTSVIQIFGANGGQYEALRGKPANGVVFSEASRMDPRVLEVVAPMLAKTRGWEVYNSTPNGGNWFCDGFTRAKNNPEHCFAMTATIEDTYDHEGNPLVTQDMIQKERDAGKTEDYIQQEYYCSFVRGIEGTYLGKQLQKARDEGRIHNNIVYDENAPVYTAWDLGVADFTAIIFFQIIGNEIHIIDYYEGSGYSFVHYKKIIDEKGFYYGAHYVPFDIYVREEGPANSKEPRAVSRLEKAANIGLNLEPLDRISFETGVENARSIMGRCIFNQEKCKILLSHLEQWGRKWNNITQEYTDWEDRNIHTHAGAAFRYMAQVVVEGTHTIENDFESWDDEQEMANVYTRL